jgi:site-specific DNA recombinase
MGIRDHPIAPRSPWQNAYVERLIGSIRRECLDHMIVFGEAHLRRILRVDMPKLLTGLLFDDAGHRMIPTHATKAGIRYRYYASAPVLTGEAKTASAGSISRVPAADIEDTIVKSLEAHFAAQQDGSTSKALQLPDRDALVQLVAEIVVHTDKLVARLKSDHTDEEPARSDDPSLTIPWQKPPSRSRRILLPHNAFRRDVQPEQFERRARLVSAIAKGRQWLDDVVSGRLTTVVNGGENPGQHGGVKAGQ